MFVVFVFRFVFSVDELSSRSFEGHGQITSVTSSLFPILYGLSLKHLVLEASSVHEPHWYTNANALGYCLVSFYLSTYLNLQKQVFFPYSLVKLQ